MNTHSKVFLAIITILIFLLSIIVLKHCKEDSEYTRTKYRYDMRVAASIGQRQGLISLDEWYVTDSLLRNLSWDKLKEWEIDVFCEQQWYEDNFNYKPK